MRGEGVNSTLTFKVLNRLVGSGMLLMARIALRHGDTHEFNHIWMGVKVANTEPCGESCPLRKPNLGEPIVNFTPVNSSSLFGEALSNLEAKPDHPGA